MAFTKEIAGKINKFTHIQKMCTQTWFTGVHVFPGHSMDTMDSACKGSSG
jgi:hypothetical protein